MKNILITGANGMLGEQAFKVFSKNKAFKVYGTYRNDHKNRVDQVFWKRIDLTNRDELHKLLKIVKPDIILHCAADVNIDNCEIDISNAEYLHSKIIKEFKKQCPNSLFIYISTDSIFNGEKGNYDEYDVPKPLNNYSKTKILGEELVKKSFHDFIIIRTNIFGFHTDNKKTSLAEWVLNNLMNDKHINGFEDIIFNPLYTLQLIHVIDILLKSEFKGIINVGSSEFISKYDFIMSIAQIFQYEKNLIIKSKSTDFVFKAKRPKNTSLNITLLKKTTNLELSLKDGLEMLKSDLQTNKL